MPECSPSQNCVWSCCTWTTRLNANGLQKRVFSLCKLLDAPMCHSQSINLKWLPSLPSIAYLLWNLIKKMITCSPGVSARSSSKNLFIPLCRQLRQQNSTFNSLPALIRLTWKLMKMGPQSSATSSSFNTNAAAEPSIGQSSSRSSPKLTCCKQQLHQRHDTWPHHSQLPTHDQYPRLLPSNASADESDQSSEPMFCCEMEIFNRGSIITYYCLQPSTSKHNRPLPVWGGFL